MRKAGIVLTYDPGRQAISAYGSDPVAITAGQNC